MIALDLIDLIAGRKVNRANAEALLRGLDAYPEAGISPPHRMAQFLAQVMHESASFAYDREIWNPAQVAAQARYDTRADLGNTPAVDGDGYANRGMGPIQLTGAGNRRRFADWCRAHGMNPPEFVGTEALLSDPWEGLSAVWYWDAGNPTGRSLNVYADDGNIEAITRKINGGLNGFEDRCRLFTRAALVLLGRDPDDVRGFQASAGFTGRSVDGIAGMNTRAALHKALVAIKPVEAAPLSLEARVAALEAAVAALRAA